MILRRRNLPPGWYPDDAEGVGKLVSSWFEGKAPAAGARAAVAPHAGWAFSGRLAALAVAALGEAETVVVVGGHLPHSAQPLAAYEDAYETPLGAIEADTPLREELSRILASLPTSALALRSDDIPDNTVEVQLPIVKARFPGSKVLWLRAPNGPAAISLGEALAEASRSLGRKLVCLGSTDLTHYGPAYGYSPAGRGQRAEAWVREVNDKCFIDALLSMDCAAVLERGESDQSACSSGAAAAAIAFATASGATHAQLLGRASSLDVRKDESFVGYAAVGFYR